MPMRIYLIKNLTKYLLKPPSGGFFIGVFIVNKLNNIIRVDIVDQLNPQTCSAVVRFEDQEDVTSSELQILVRGSVKNKDYWMPSVNDAVVCLFSRC